MTGAPWTWRHGGGPVIATAIHAGHDLRADVAALTALDDAARLREEDPFTDRWTDSAPSAVVFNRSRWEVDVNRTRDRAVYLEPEDCWGLRPWTHPPPSTLMAESLGLYDRFYAELHAACEKVIERHGGVVILDLHSYNHRRLGPDGPAADPEDNPGVNVGTATLNRQRWGALVDRFLANLRACELDARENVRFRGAELAAWAHRTFRGAACCLAVDVKKVFMDEHTGVGDDAEVRRVGDALASTLPDLVRGVRR